MVKVGKIIDFIISEEISFQYQTDNELDICEIGDPSTINDYSIYWAKDENKLERFQNSDSSKILVIASENLNPKISNYICVEDPKKAFFSILEHFFGTEKPIHEIHPSSVILTDRIGENITIGANTFIGSEVTIADNVWIKNNVSIEGKVIINSHSTISSGCTIGSEGYGYIKDSNGFLKKVPHYGGVQIGENVEIGANTCIDRGTLGDTIIGDNVKIDNLCHIAHNVIIEENVNVIAMSMIAGSVTLKKNSYVAPAASIINQVTIGENSLVGIGAVVVKSVDNNVVVAGVPAKFIKENK